MADNEEFVDQLEQEALEKKKTDNARIRVDPDGTQYEWDEQKRAWFPKIDADFIAQYQMNYGSQNETDQSTNTTTATTGTTTATTGTTSTGSTADTTASETTPPTDTPPAGMPDVNDPNYYDWWHYYYGDRSKADAGGEGSDKEGGDSSEAGYDWDAYYKAYYAANPDAKQAAQPPGEKTEGEGSDDHHDHYFDQYMGENYTPVVDPEEEVDPKQQKKIDKQKKEATPAGVKREREPPKWFEVEADKQPQVYVSGMPADITYDEFNETMTRCGLVMFDPHTKKPKLKLYKNKDGTMKGDGLCCYIKQESVTLAMQLLDGSDLRGSTMHVERATFELKGEYDPSKKRKALSNKAKKKLKENQQKLFDWRPDKVEVGERKRFERVIILTNMFDPKEFETDPGEINELSKDMREECSKFGTVRKVTIYDRHKDGIAGVMFSTPEEADTAKAALNGRWFAQKQIIATTWDGKTKYEVEETEEERQKRLAKWQAYLEGNTGMETSKDGSHDANSKPCGTTECDDAPVDDKGASAGNSVTTQAEEKICGEEIVPNACDEEDAMDTASSSDVTNAKMSNELNPKTTSDKCNDSTADTTKS